MCQIAFQLALAWYLGQIRPNLYPHFQGLPRKLVTGCATKHPAKENKQAGAAVRIFSLHCFVVFRVRVRAKKELLDGGQFIALGTAGDRFGSRPPIKKAGGVLQIFLHLPLITQVYVSTLGTGKDEP